MLAVQDLSDLCVRGPRHASVNAADAWRIHNACQLIPGKALKAPSAPQSTTHCRRDAADTGLHGMNGLTGAQQG